MELNLHLGSCTPVPMGLINCGLETGIGAALLFLLRIVAEFDGTRETFAGFQFIPRGASG